MPADERPYRRRVLVNTASTSAANVWAMVVMIVWVPVLLHGLGAQAFGVWAVLQAFSASNGWLSIAELGVGTSVTHFVATHAGGDNRDGAAAAARAGRIILFVVGAVCAVAMLVFGLTVFASIFHVPERLHDDLRIAMPFFCLQIVPDLLLTGSTSALEGYQRVDLSRLTDGIRRTLVAVATIIVALAGGGLGGVALASLLATAAAAVLGAAQLRRHTRGASAAHWAGEIRSIATYAWRVAIVDASGVIHRSMDRVIVGAAIGPAAVTLVEIATQIQNGANAVLSATSYAVTSSSAWLRSRGDTGTLRELLERGTRYSLLLTWPVAVMSAVLAGPLIHVWVGARYHDAAGLAVVALLPLIAAPLQVGSNMLRGTGRVQRIVGPALISTAINLVASIVLVQIYGAVGVFLGTLIGTIVLIPMLGYAVLDEYDMRLSDFTRTAVIPAVVPNLVLLATGLGCVAVLGGPIVTIVVTGAIGLAVYTLVTFRVGLSRGEVAELLNGLRRQPSAS